MSPRELDRHLEKIDSSRREFFRRLLLGAAYAAPLVASFSLDNLFVAPARAQGSNIQYLCPSNLGVGSNIANVVINKTASPEPVASGQDLTYTITIYNCGPDPALGVVFQDALPVGTKFVSASNVSGPAFTLSTPPVGSQGGVVSGSLISMVVGATSVVQIVVTVD